MASRHHSLKQSAVTTFGAKFGWYGRRLLTMEPKEILWRLHRMSAPRNSTLVDTDAVMGCSSRAQWEEALQAFRTDTETPALLDSRKADLIAQTAPDSVARLIDAAQLACKPTFQFFSYPPITLRHPLDWNYDPISDVHWPAVSSGRINHRVGLGDVKWIWELNRLQHLPILAQAWLFTGEDHFSRTAFSHLDSWIAQNPPGSGIAWRGAFEAGIRAISIAVALQGFRHSEELTADRFRKIINVLVQSASICCSDRSRYSSANNHLIGEMAGLAVISIVLPQLATSSVWEREAISALCAEASNQILPDGAGAEQAVGYQVFIVELINIVAVLLFIRDGAAPKPLVEAVRRSTRFLAAIVGAGDSAPRYGDDDEGFAVRLGPAPVRTIRDHLGITGASGWGITEFHAASDSLDAQWFRAVANEARDRSVRTEQVVTDSEPLAQLYANEGGLVVMRRGGHRITMDVGPLGYLSIAAHGHADSLAITLSDCDGDLIGDPGTGSYYGHPEWRAAMRATAAHATVSVDGRDQSVAGGPFLWVRHAKTRVRAVDLARGVVDAEHYGYRQLHGRVTHRRWLTVAPDDNAYLIVDLVTGAGVHEVKNSWPLHPSVSIQHLNDGHVLQRSGVPVIKLLHAATAPIACADSRGDEEMQLGWWSNRLESRIPTWWLGTVSTTSLPVAMATLMVPANGIAATDLKIALQNTRVFIQWSRGNQQHSAIIDTRHSAAISWSDTENREA
ncbi:alginate lyase family protein [Mycolicibacterium gilvum]|uniref:Heparinase II/III-like protein n=1 Tax=Mycolicibacterium gilvum (strain DSM 45189 / LMG 24558 / Spyr1) TaxID=278137 RepID=E6TAS2_MYCSR|nr:alginate lyase family protein [Mycolicibacterium gilvum]ADU00722.1 Heparinase II/III-like protein [Mycolicibacterium gilvum Spyr1]